MGRDISRRSSTAAVSAVDPHHETEEPLQPFPMIGQRQQCYPLPASAEGCKYLLCSKNISSARMKISMRISTNTPNSQFQSRTPNSFGRQLRQQTERIPANQTVPQEREFGIPSLHRATTLMSTHTQKERKPKSGIISKRAIGRRRRTSVEIPYTMYLFSTNPCCPANRTVTFSCLFHHPDGSPVPATLDGGATPPLRLPAPNGGSAAAPAPP